MTGGKLELAALVQELRAELEHAIGAAEGADLQFGLREVEIELQVVAESKSTDKGGVKFWVLEAGMEEEASRSSVQTIRLTLDPRLANGGSANIGSDTPTKPV